MFKFIITFFLLFATLLTAKDPLIKTGEIRYLGGNADVLIRHDLFGTVVPARNGDILFEKDTVMTGPKSRTFLTMGKDTLLSLDAMGSLTLNSRWQIVQNIGAATYRIRRIYPDSKLEIITSFAAVYASSAAVQIDNGREKSVRVLHGHAHIRNFLGNYHYYSSDITCHDTFAVKTPFFNLKAGEKVTFIPPYAIKTCGEVGEALVKDDQSIIVYAKPLREGIGCEASTPGVDKESDITQIQKRGKGCFLMLENAHSPCQKLAQKNVLFSLFRERDNGIEIELRPLNQAKESYVQFKCR